MNSESGPFLAPRRSRGRARLALATPLCLVLGYGCGTGLVTADRTELGRLKEEPAISVVHYRPPFFIVKTPAGSYPFVGGYVYLATAKDAGDRMIAEYGLVDPSRRVRDRLVASLAADLDIKGFEMVRDSLDSDSLDELRTRFPGRLVLDFKTDLWTLHGPAFSARRRFFYIMRARLVRTSDQRVMWRGWCSAGRDEATAREWDELVADRGALLRARLDEVADACADRLRSQMLTGDEETAVK